MALIIRYGKNLHPLHQLFSHLSGYLSSRLNKNRWLCLEGVRQDLNLWFTINYVEYFHVSTIDSRDNNNEKETTKIHNFVKGRYY